MDFKPTLDWTRAKLIEWSPDWIDQTLLTWPDWALFAAAPVALFLVIGWFLKRIIGGVQDAKSGYSDAYKLVSGQPLSPPPTATEAKQDVQTQKLAALAEQNEELQAKLDAVLAAVSPERALGAEEAAAKRRAVGDIVADTSPAAQEAVRDFVGGDRAEGFAVLEREAQAAEAEAFEKWRRLGDLAFGVDTARAVEAYSQAHRLRPDDFWTCIHLANAMRDAGDVAAALEAAKAAERAAAEDREVSIAAHTVADMLALRGELNEAKPRFETGLEALKRLAAANPSSAEAQRDVSVSLKKLENVMVTQGDIDGGKARLEASLDLAERLAAANPSSAEAQRDVSVSLEKLGEVLVEQGDLNGAKARFEEDLAIAERLAAADPSSAQAQRDVSVSLNKLGGVLVQQGELDGARARFEASLAIRERLAAANPSSAQAQRDVSVSLERLGDVLVEQGDLDGAKARFEASLAIRERLAAANPSSAEAQRDVIVSYAKLAEVDPTGGWWGKALEVAERLHAEGRLAPADLGRLEMTRQKAAEERAAMAPDN
ncbi:MAG: tetratricopeptide repeat protein [Geminicoccaceae bacterium]